MRISPATLAYMAERQEVTCRGCIYADPETTGTGHPCCQFGGKLQYSETICLTRKEDQGH